MAAIERSLPADLRETFVAHPLPRANEIGAVARALRPHIGSGDAVTYPPPSLSRTGDYYGLPFDPRVRAPAGLPGERFGQTWVVVAHSSALPTSITGQVSSRAVAHQIAQLDRLLTGLAVDYGVG